VISQQLRLNTTAPPPRLKLAIRTSSSPPVFQSTSKPSAPHNKIIVAIANKLARIAWAVLSGLREQHAMQLHSTFGQAAHVRGRVKRKTVPSLLVPPWLVVP
jgi:hypothetical protein